jgi:hypothetical protein
MKAISIKQPHASRIASGEKTIELRTWTTTYRGPLLVCVSAKPKLDNLPVGVAICAVNLSGIRRATKEDSAAACFSVDPRRHFAWILSDAKLLEFVLPVKGRLGLYDVEINHPIISTIPEIIVIDC